MFFSVLLSDNLLLVSFCLYGPVVDVSVIGSEGIPGIDALTRSSRTAVLRKIFLRPTCEAYFPQKSCCELIPNLPSFRNRYIHYRLRYGI